MKAQQESINTSFSKDGENKVYPFESLPKPGDIIPPESRQYIDYLSKTATEWDKATADKAKGIITESLMKDYLWEHRDQIVASALKSEKAKWVKEENEKNHNPSLPNMAQRPAGDDKVQETLNKAKSDFDEMMGKRK